MPNTHTKYFAYLGYTTDAANAQIIKPEEPVVETKEVQKENPIVEENAIPKSPQIIQNIIPYNSSSMKI